MHLHWTWWIQKQKQSCRWVSIKKWSHTQNSVNKNGETTFYSIGIRQKHAYTIFSSSWDFCLPITYNTCPFTNKTLEILKNQSFPFPGPFLFHPETPMIQHKTHTRTCRHMRFTCNKKLSTKHFSKEQADQIGLQREEEWRSNKHNILICINFMVQTQIVD